MSDKTKDFNLTPGENEQYKPVTAEITCSKCGKKNTLTLRACVNVSLHPEEKEQVLDGSFFHYKCHIGCFVCIPGENGSIRCSVGNCFGTGVLLAVLLYLYTQNKRVRIYGNRLESQNTNCKISYS